MKIVDRNGIPAQVRKLRNPQPEYPDPLISPKALSQLLGVSDVTIWRMRRDKIIPQPIQISAGRVGWRQSTIEKFLSDRAKA